MITIDFETYMIVNNPVWDPPKSVGCAVWVEGHEPTYLAWGHPNENNIGYKQAFDYLNRVFSSGEQLLFHNAPFDIAVWEAMRGRGTFRDFTRVHDTQYLLFLMDPYAPTLSLKPSAARYLNMPPEEQDELKNWILGHVPEATERDWGGYIAKAPGELVGRYAIGDVVRTRKLFDLLHPKVCETGMEAAYDRERALMPVLFQSSYQGIRVDRKNLEADRNEYTRALETADDTIRSVLNSPKLDFGKRGELAQALDDAGLVTQWSYTPTGKKSTAKKNLKIDDGTVAALVKYRGALNTCLSTFFGPWLELSRTDSRLHTSWNSVRTVERDSRGTQTGRLSSNTPNFQNVPTDFSGLKIPEGLPPLPHMRKYLLPEVGHLWLKRDFSSQEVRILAHFEDGSLCLAYCDNPDLDPHEMARRLILDSTGMDLLRKKVKIVAFSIIYGAGVPGVQRQLECETYEEAKAVKDAYLDAMPDVKNLVRDIQRLGKSGGFIRTWGGRAYYAEPPKDGRTFEYKLLNYLIQGSAADQTKQSIIDWQSERRWSHVFLATVHDEINISAPIEEADEAMRILRECMDRDRFDVPFKSEGFRGPNWQDIVEVE